MKGAVARVTPSAQARVLVVDDEPVVQDVLGTLLGRAGYQSAMATSAEEAIVRLDSEDPDLVLLDVMLPDQSGLEVLREIKKRDPDRLVIMMTAHGSVADAVAAMKDGAYDYLTKPFANEEVLLLVEKALDARRLRRENRRLRSLLSPETSFEGIVGRSETIRAVFRLVEQVAPSRSTVLIVGESGTGKELVARAVHHRSRRAGSAFVTVHSGSIPPDLMESNLFGHVKGAFTGAVFNREGLFKAADGGTLFLDEISTLRPDLQAKLLRVMQERDFMPVGTNESVSVDVRILAATNVDLKTLVERGDFREDLYYRLNVLKVEIPPLRRRSEDIPLLVNHFVTKYSLENEKQLAGVEPTALAALTEYDWPGNVRELENAIIQAVVLTPGPRLRLEDLPSDLLEGEGIKPDPDGERPLPEALAVYERHLIQKALRRAGGVQRRAARLLGIRPTTLSEKIKRLGLRPGPP
ncbi:MAG: sigma-54-dependent transcriptional regulator [Acidobacteriota bacterium]